MGRWEPDARGRLRAAALELFDERGFDGTTVAEIADRAGLTERTFFRHFADKREVLFAGAEALEGEMVRTIEEAPPSMPAMKAVALGLRAIAEQIPNDREYVRRRSAIIAANPELQERERNKLAALADAAAAALRKRGVEKSVAYLASETGIAVFRAAFARWLAENDDRTLTGFISQSLEELRAVTASF
ncbi:MAG TPA: TetR family transcriptional regulator [Candidatus Acidoferrales bacterium]|nr:TetR family transcriptional regulator [Candidatus Acidoferrales bacterium]